MALRYNSADRVGRTRPLRAMEACDGDLETLGAGQHYPGDHRADRIRFGGAWVNFGLTLSR